MDKHNKHFRVSLGMTLLEILLVLIVIGILSVMVLVSLNSSRIKARDTKRAFDLKQLSEVLEFYNTKHGTYPATITPGAPIISPNGLVTYLKSVPSNPRPRAEGPCNDSDYLYTGGADNYSLIACFGKGTPQIEAGAKKMGKDGASRYLGPTNGLIGWWMLDGLNGTKDLAGTSNGSLDMGTSTVATSTGRFGEPNGAYSFNGVNSKVDASVNYQGLPFSLAVWYKFNATVNATPGMIGFTDASGNRKEVYITNTGVIRLFYFNGTAREYQVTNASASRLTGWHLLVATYNGTTPLVYLDGAKINLTTPATFGLGPVNNVRLGRISVDITGNQYNLNGLLSDARIYNRALTSEEVDALFSNR